MEDLERGIMAFTKKYPGNKVMTKSNWWRRLCWWASKRYVIVDMEKLEKRLK
jgi:hypothetical protein